MFYKHNRLFSNRNNLTKFGMIIRMTSWPIIHLRLRNQGFAKSVARTPVEVVQWLGAIQSQDFLAAKWAVGQRITATTDALVEQAYNAGTILRTHLLRPTWHFVTPDDIRWMLALTAPQVKVKVAYNNRRLGLDQAVLARGNAVFDKALRGGRHLTREELAPLLIEAGVISASDDPLRFLHVLINAELDGVVCSGALHGKQHTYALLEERAPNSRVLEREEALAALARRYFTSRGPATLKDYIWWSGLPVTDARAGLAMIKSQLVEEKIDGQSYWLDPSSLPATQEIAPTVHLLPNYDEYIVSYADRSAIYDPGRVKQVDARGNFLFNHTIVVDGQVAGTWKRALRKKSVEITPNLFYPLSEAEIQALSVEMSHYSDFLGLPRMNS